MSNFVQGLICVYFVLGSFYFLFNCVKGLLSFRAVKKVDNNQLNNIFNNFMRGN